MNLILILLESSSNNPPSKWFSLDFFLEDFEIQVFYPWKMMQNALEFQCSLVAFSDEK